MRLVLILLFVICSFFISLPHINAIEVKQLPAFMQIKTPLENARQSLKLTAVWNGLLAPELIKKKIESDNLTDRIDLSCNRNECEARVAYERAKYKIRVNNSSWLLSDDSEFILPAVGSGFNQLVEIDTGLNNDPDLAKLKTISLVSFINNLESQSLLVQRVSWEDDFVKLSIKDFPCELLISHEIASKYDQLSWLNKLTIRIKKLKDYYQASQQNELEASPPRQIDLRYEDQAVLIS